MRIRFASWGVDCGPLRFERFIGWALAVAAVLLAGIPAFAEHTRWWRQSSFEDFAKGTAKGVALRSDGKLFLAPSFAEFADANLAYVVALRADSKGNLYAGGGSNAKVLRIDPGGTVTTAFESSELAAQALAIDASGNLFVGTSPDGKVYKVTPDGKSSVFFEPKTKYIWDLSVDRDGTLYVATGDTGKIFSVSPNGTGQLFYASTETHIRSLALDSNGNVLAGTEPSGLVLRIPKAIENPGPSGTSGRTSAPAPPNTRRAFVLYETAKKEITAMLFDSVGNLYVSSVGEKTATGQQRPASENPPTPGTFTITVGGANITPGQPQQVQATPLTPGPTAISSSVYKISPDGSPDELWSSRDELVYALGLLPSGNLVLGTGNEGGVLELEGNHIFARLAKAAAKQITAMALSSSGKLFLAAANPGKVFMLGPKTELEGSFESQPFDAQIFSRWGQLQWLTGFNPVKPKNGSPSSVEFYARSGNTSDPENNWSPWAGPYANRSGERVDCPPARFIQWKAVLHSTDGPAPELDWISLAYLPKNIAPSVTAIAIQSPGIRVQGLSVLGTGLTPQTTAQVRVPQPANASTSPSSFSAAPSFNAALPTARFDPVPQGYSQKGYQSVLWTAEDVNEDPLEFTIYFRGENESTWRVLKDKLDTRFYSWDTTTMPDGAYWLKIEASDAPSNPAGDELTGSRESDRFEVDNTPPIISQLIAEANSAAKGNPMPSVRVRFQANDPGSAIGRAQYSLDAADWILVFPVGSLSDSNRESYDFQLQKVAPGEHTVAVRVYDQFETVTSAKVTVLVPAGGSK